MEFNLVENDSKRFEIIFEKLEEAKKEQQSELAFDFNSVSETYQIASLFKEFRESFESACVVFTRS